MKTAEGFAPAKINLTLHVTGQRADGYHLLDSLVVFSDVGDRLSYEPGREMSLTVSGPFADGVPTDARNLVWKAAEISGWTGHIHLEKNLPHGAGIGGGSSDAAAVLRDLNGPLKEADSLGADVPVCVSRAPQRMRGIGDVLETVDAVPAMHLVLVNPGGYVPTPSVFHALSTKNNVPMDDLPEVLTYDAFLKWLSMQRNDLQGPALSCAPQIADALHSLAGADLVRMSGSGATCFGLFREGDSAQTAARQIARTYPNWWVQSCLTYAAKS